MRAAKASRPAAAKSAGAAAVYVFTLTLTPLLVTTAGCRSAPPVEAPQGVQSTSPSGPAIAHQPTARQAVPAGYPKSR